MGQVKRIRRTVYMDKEDEGMQWGRISGWDRLCTWIRRMKGCSRHNKWMGQTVYMDKEDEGKQWGEISGREG